MESGFNIEEILQSYNQQLKKKGAKKNFEKEVKKALKTVEGDNVSTDSPSKKSE